MKTKIAISLATAYLLTFTVLCATNTLTVACSFMYLFSPVATVIMVLVVLTEKGYHYRELTDDEEWGYRDKDKNKLRLF